MSPLYFNALTLLNQDKETKFFLSPILQLMYLHLFRSKYLKKRNNFQKFGNVRYCDEDVSSQVYESVEFCLPFLD